MPGKLVEKLLEGGKGELLAEEKGLLLAGGGKGEPPKGSAAPVEANGEDAKVLPGKGERVELGKDWWEEEGGMKEGEEEGKAKLASAPGEKESWASKGKIFKSGVSNLKSAWQHAIVPTV